jgi:DNA-binding beta-propeller fold protein YncE
MRPQGKDASLLEETGVIKIPAAADTQFDHGAFEPATRLVFVAHTARDRVEVLDDAAGRHVATLEGFPEAAGVVADAGQVLVTSRGSAELAVVDAHSLKTRAVLKTAPRPNGVALVASRRLAVVACIGDAAHAPELQVIGLAGQKRWSAVLPGRPRWCVTDRAGERVMLAVRQPSMVWTARLPDLADVRTWPLPSDGAHGMDIDHAGGTLYVACDAGALLALDAATGEMRREWPLAGPPDATFFNPASGFVHVAVAEPGLVQSIDPRSGRRAGFSTGRGAKTTALVPPDRLHVFSPPHQGALVLAER